jgi:hypothetical protein
VQRAGRVVGLEVRFHHKSPSVEWMDQLAYHACDFDRRQRP